MPEREPRRYRVYVIKLRKSVWERSRRFREANPQYEVGRPCVYVGSTGRTPEQRFAKHKAGGVGTSRLVKRFGRALFPWAYERLPSYETREEAERAEEERAEELKRRGWAVWYNARSLKERLGRMKQR
ncbi:MAG: ribose-5-phosphate isomerase [Gemmatimonadetes bacterium]|nr:ribose-5-phosphate isomerase [Gemmatimonadota bacterium]